MRAWLLSAVMLAACGQSAVQPPDPTAPSEDRAEVVSRLPFIDACLALSPEARTVTINRDSNFSVQLTGENGTFDCVVPEDAPDSSNAAILPALDEPPAGAIVFVRAPGANPGGECYEAPEVRKRQRRVARLAARSGRLLTGERAGFDQFTHPLDIARKRAILVEMDRCAAHQGVRLL